MDQGQVLLFGGVLALAAFVSLLVLRGVIPSPAKHIGAWSATRPTIQRGLLATVYWTGLALSCVACGIYICTTLKTLPVAWNDAAQFLLGLVLTVDSAISGRRVSAAIAIVFMAFSARELVLHP